MQVAVKEWTILRPEASVKCKGYVVWQEEKVVETPVLLNYFRDVWCSDWAVRLDPHHRHDFQPVIPALIITQLTDQTAIKISAALAWHVPPYSHSPLQLLLFLIECHSQYICIKVRGHITLKAACHRSSYRSRYRLTRCFLLYYEKIFSRSTLHYPMGP